MIFFVLYVLPATGIRFILVGRQTAAFDPRRLVPIALTLGVRPLAFFTSVAAAATSDALAQDYVQTARSKGLSQRQVLLYHVWPNILPAVLDAIPVTLLFSVSSLPIVEFVFNWPGMGLQLLMAVVGRPRPGVQPAALVSFLLASVGITYVVSVLVIKALRLRVDPRARGGMQS
jgi:peptide/nickel transport system permease protein